MLAGYSTRSKSFSSYFGTVNLPEKIPAEELEELVIKLRAGDSSVAPRIMQGHIRLACQIAGRYMWAYGRKSDDIICAAMLGIAQAVQWARERMHDNNIAPYITTTVHRHIADYLEKDHLIPIPRSQFRKAIKEQKDIDFVPLYFQFKPTMADMDNSVAHDDREYDFEPGIIDFENALECEDFYAELELTDTERKVINLRIENYTMKEIGEHLGLSKMRISQLINGLQDKFGRYMKLKGVEHG